MSSSYDNDEFLNYEERYERSLNKLERQLMRDLDEDDVLRVDELMRTDFNVRYSDDAEADCKSNIGHSLKQLEKEKARDRSSGHTEALLDHIASKTGQSKQAVRRKARDILSDKPGSTFDVW